MYYIQREIVGVVEGKGVICILIYLTRYVVPTCLT